MKKFTLIILLTFTILTISNAQFDAKNLYGGFTVGAGLSHGKASDFVQLGFKSSIEVGYNVTEKLSTGFEYGSLLSAGANRDTVMGGFFNGATIFGFSVYTIQTYKVKANYRFTTGQVHPFVGIGLGVANVREPILTDAEGNDVRSSRTGFAASIEAGVSIYGFILSYGYSIDGSTPKEPIFNRKSADLLLNFSKFSAGYLYNF